MNRAARLAMLLVLGCACISTNHAVKPGGDVARIALRNGTNFPAELLAVGQNDLYFLNNRRVWRTPLAEVTSVHVEGYSLKGAKYAVLGLFGAADVALSVFAFAQGGWPFGAIVLPLFAAGMYISTSSEPRVDFRPPLSLSSRGRLAAYCRYPNELTSTQWQELLTYYHQDRFDGPADMPRP